MDSKEIRNRVMEFMNSQKEDIKEGAYQEAKEKIEEEFYEIHLDKTLFELYMAKKFHNIEPTIEAVENRLELDKEFIMDFMSYAERKGYISKRKGNFEGEPLLLTGKGIKHIQMIIDKSFE
ncbi:hypothetical protein [Halonatronum saccharophilum]|uniref:hypothetical protein n=1 Tax=Halonatronum saccharophilum TaxID=150060 RepID=UPI00048514D4|nr:hypothetical protein [Halonatronum saccharophilum]